MIISYFWKLFIILLPPCQLYFFFLKTTVFLPVLFSGLKSGIIPRTLPFSVLIVGIYVAENLG